MMHTHTHANTLSSSTPLWSQGGMDKDEYFMQIVHLRQNLEKV